MVVATVKMAEGRKFLREKQIRVVVVVVVRPLHGIRGGGTTSRYQTFSDLQCVKEQARRIRVVERLEMVICWLVEVVWQQ